MVLNYGNCVLLNKVTATLWLPVTFSLFLPRQCHVLFAGRLLVSSFRRRSSDAFLGIACRYIRRSLLFSAEQLVLRFSLKLSSDETDPADQGEGRLADERRTSRQEDRCPHFSPPETRLLKQSNCLRS